MALTDVYDAGYDKSSDVRKQVAGACFVAAMDIEAEDPGTANHANRIIWAAQAKANPKGKAAEMIFEVIANATIRAALPTPVDGDVQFVVNSLIDTYATG